jgi:hypothetical protein
MSLLLLPLLIALGICVVPIWLLPGWRGQPAREYFLSSHPTPPDVLRNAFVAHPLRIASLGPLFVWGASGELWPAIVGAACLGLGIYLVYVLRGPLLAFLDSALSDNQSATVPAFIARSHGNDAPVRLLTAGLSVVALTGLINAEAFATAILVRPFMPESAYSVYVIAAVMLGLAGLTTAVAGNSGVMHSVQLQVGMMYLGLFGSIALLLYFLVSDFSAMPPHGSFAVLLVAAACIAIPWCRRLKYVDNTPIGSTSRRAGAPASAADARPPAASRLLRTLEKTLNILISVLVVLALVLIAMEWFSVGLPVIAREGLAALQTGTRMSAASLLTIAVVPLLTPIVDAALWQRLAVIAKETASEPALRSATLARIFRSLAVEMVLLLLLMCMLGAIAVIAAETPAGRDALQAFIGVMAAEESAPGRLAAGFLLVFMFFLALPAMSSMLSASLWVLRYDMLPALWPALAAERIRPEDERIARQRAVLIGCGLCLAAFLLVVVADSLLGMVFTAATFLAVLLACWCAQIPSFPLLVTSLVQRSGSGTVSACWALLVVAVAATVGIAAVIAFLATGAEPWLWAAVPACLGSGLVLFAVARLGRGHRSTAR